jgi:hypothetical protein
MDFDLHDDETAVIEAARQVAAAADPWAALVAGGWLDLLADDAEATGLGYLGLVAEELGASAVAVPLVGTGAVWPTLFGESAGGRRVGVVDGPDGLCEDGAGAEVVVVLGDHEAEAFESFTTAAVGRLDGDALARVASSAEPVARAADGLLVAGARLRAAAVAASEMAGTMRRISEMTTAYVAERQQFGRPISAFQVVAHGAARLATLAEAATWSARLACRSPVPDHTHAAKGWISQASQEAAALAHQLHGAIGFTEEYGLQRLTKRLRTVRFAWGDDRFHHLALGTIRVKTGT